MTPAPILDRPSPNFDARPRAVDLVVLHYTGMQDEETALARLTDPAPVAGRYPGPWQPRDADPAAPLARVSSHYVVAEDGRLWRLVNEDARAWHAGSSWWDGESAVNDRAIGVEIVNGGHDFGLPDFPDAQIEALIALLRDVLTRRGLGPHRVVGHSDVAPARKLDPGERFPWAKLAGAGVALWPLAAHPPGPAALAKGVRGQAVRVLQESLRAFGYGVPETGEYDDLTEAAVAAFQRRFRPQRIDGAADEQTMAILADVAAQNLRLSLPRLRS